MNRNRSLRAGLAAVAGLALTLSVAAPGSAEPRPKDPDEIYPSDTAKLAAAATVPCVAGGPTADDHALATQLNGQLTNKMAGYLNGYRVSCARAVVQTVKGDGFNQKAAAIAIATTIVESSIDNLRDPVDYDSVGLFQQRPSAGWGTADQCRDAVYATRSFLRVMQQFYPNGSWDSAPIGEVAADVQRPAAQYRYRYGVEANDAIKIVAALWSRGARPRSAQESGRIVSAQSADGRLEAFAAGADGVWHAWQTQVNGAWSAWERIGGPANAELAVAPNADGRLELFAINGSTFDHKWQTSASGSWSGWESFGGGGKDIAAGYNADGRIEVFASSGAGVFHRWQTAPSGGWSAWEGTHGGPANAQLAVESNSDGRLEVFALNGSTFGHLFQTAASGSWGSWETFGGGGTDLTVDHNADGRLEVFASGPVGVFHKWMTGATTWSAWESLGGPASSQLTSDRSVDGRIEVFAINGDTASHTFQTARNAGFAAWESFGTGGTEIAGTHNRDGRIEILAGNPSGVFHKWQTSGTTWSAWAWLRDAGPGIG
ncbi:hypothetical protein [Nocardioides sp. LML1-1-1.1]|uniref:hypothetical protein n=1 Tax=Nocardioides sp. LML1-1-1.1 TaxID=3135248 RepID=UPI00342374AF